MPLVFLYPPSHRKINLFLDWIHPMFPNFVDWPKYNEVIYWPDFGHITFQNKKYSVLLSIHERFRALSKDSAKEIKCVAFRTRTSYLVPWNITSNFRKNKKQFFRKSRHTNERNKRTNGRMGVISLNFLVTQRSKNRIRFNSRRICL